MHVQKISQIQRSYTKLQKTISRTTLPSDTNILADRHPDTNTPSDCLSPIVEENHPRKVSKSKKLKQMLLNPPPVLRPSIPNPYATQLTQGSAAQPTQDLLDSTTTQTNLVSNQESDHIWIGHCIRKPRPSCARIWIQNVNGLDIKHNFNPYLEHLEFIRRYNINFLALTETHLNPCNVYVRDNIEASHKIAYPEGYVKLTNTLLNNCEDTKQSGGVLVSTQGKLSNRYAGSGSDPGGRFAWMDFYGKEVFLRIYTVYRVCQNNDALAGDSQAWTLQREWLKSKGVHNNPRSQVLKDIQHAIANDLKQKRHVLVVGDFNENVFGTKGELTNTMNELGLSNILRSHINIPEGARSHCRGSKIIDGAWSTPYIQSRILSCGLAPFDFLYPSDHRGIFLDLDILDILDARTVDVKPPPYRRLKSSIPKRVKTYCEEVEAKWNNHKIKEKIDKLEDMSTVIDDVYLRNSFVNFLNQYDDEISGILQSAERNCCNVSRHCTYLFTPSLQKTLRLKRQLQQQLNKKKKIDVTNSNPFLLTEIKGIKRNLQEVNKDLREYSKKQREKRDEFLEERAKDVVQQKGLPKSKIQSVVKNLKHIEKQITDAKRIRTTLKPSSRTRIDYVLIPAVSQYSISKRESPGFNHHDIDVIWPRLQLANGKDITEWEEVENTVQVESLILDALQKHFSQASDTLITTPKWREILKSKKGQDELLNGTLEWDENIPSDFKSLLSTFHKNQRPSKEITFCLTFAAFQKFIQSSKENKSTSPSSRHYGHYKALLQDIPDVLQDIFRLMNLAVQNGIFLNRYKKTLTTLICKESGTPYLHRFRPIHIIEAELQFISKSIWAKKMINFAENNNQITDAQYGGRNGRQAQSSVLNTVLYYDVHRQLRKDYTSNDDDMKANFDREIPHYVAAESRSIGMSHEAGQFLIQATQNQEYFIRTPNGVSDQSYKFTEARPIWGLGQGVGWAGACWQLTATTISKCMDENCLGISLCCPEKDVTVEKLMDFFIDDTKKMCNQMKDGLSLREQTEFNMQRHTYYIATTGGSLALDKCTWYQIGFAFDTDGEPFILNKQQLPGDIEVFRNFGGEKVQIKRLDFDEAHRTLGYFVSPDGNNEAHYEFTSELVRKWKSRILSSRLTSFQIRKSYDSVLLRQIVYRLVATSFTYQQCNDLVKQISPILLHSAGMQEHFPRAIMEAGPEYVGFGWTHLYDLHGQEKLKFFTMHLRKNDTTAHLLRISMKHTQLQLGISQPFLSTNYDEFSYLSQNTWVTHLWEYASSRGLDITLTDPIVLPKQCKTDEFIMDILHQDSTLTKEECIIANKVRVNLQILHLSDIVDGRGRRLLPDVRHGKLYKLSTLQWPRQILLKKWMPVWHKVCGVLQRYVSRNCLSADRRSKYQQWKWNVDATKKYLTNGHEYYKKIQTRRGTYFIPQQGPPGEPIQYTHAVDVAFMKSRPQVIHVYGRNLYEETHTPSTTSSKDDTSNLFGDTFGRWGNLTQDIEEEIVENIKAGTLLAGLDGSVTKGQGAYSFGFFDPSSTPIYLYHGPVHGDNEQQNSTRSEMHGILGLVLCLRYIANKYKLHGPFRTITVYGDNTESLRIARVGPSSSLKNVFTSDMDICYELFYHVHHHCFSFDFEHVKAHQDDTIDYEDLSFSAKINVQCDKFVTKYYTDPLPTCVHHLQKIPHYQQQKVSISNQYTRITSSFQSNIHRYKIGHEAETQCARTWNIKPSSLPAIDWKNLWTESKSRRGSARFSMCKAIHRQWPTMAREKAWERSQSALCPFCKQEPEDIRHVFQCQHGLIKANRAKLLSQFKMSLVKFKTYPTLTNHVCRTLYQFCGGFKVSKVTLSEETRASEPLLEWVERAINTQLDLLGLLNLFFGVVTPVFTHCQHAYYKEHSFGRNYTSEKWGRWFIRALIDTTISIWKYRCELLHDRKEGTMETRLRDLAVDWLMQLKHTPTILPIGSRHLVDRSARYFRKGDIRAVNAWIRRIDLAIRQEKLTPDTSDIRKWLVQNDPLPNENGSDLDSISDFSTSSEISYDSYPSTGAVRDLNYDVDSISTFPYEKPNLKKSLHLYQTEYVLELPDNALKPPAHESGIYAHVRFHVRRYKNCIEDTTDDESKTSVCEKKVN